MREIEFRGKNLNDCWLYGSLVWDSFNKRYEINFYDNELDFEASVVVVQETIGQYTGLTDKNGTKIFEGDIIKHKYGKTLNGEPKYIYYCLNYCEDDRCLRAFKNGLKGYAYTINFARYVIKEKDLEVIGNWFDNPELLKVEE